MLVSRFLNVDKEDSLKQEYTEQSNNRQKTKKNIELKSNEYIETTLEKKESMNPNRLQRMNTTETMLSLSSFSGSPKVITKTNVKIPFFYPMVRIKDVQKIAWDIEQPVCLHGIVTYYLEGLNFFDLQDEQGNSLICQSFPLHMKLIKIGCKVRILGIVIAFDSEAYSKIPIEYMSNFKNQLAGQMLRVNRYSVISDKEYLKLSNQQTPIKQIAESTNLVIEYNQQIRSVLTSIEFKDFYQETDFNAVATTNLYIDVLKMCWVSAKKSRDSEITVSKEAILSYLQKTRLVHWYEKVNIDLVLERLCRNELFQLIKVDMRDSIQLINPLYKFLRSNFPDSILRRIVILMKSEIKGWSLQLIHQKLHESYYYQKGNVIPVEIVALMMVELHLRNEVYPGTKDLYYYHHKLDYS